jgi:hypothetical protein
MLRLIEPSASPASAAYSVEAQRVAAAHALARYRHEMQVECVGSDEERVIDFLVCLLHLCDERDVCLDLALHQAERLYVDELGIGPLEGEEDLP